MKKLISLFLAILFLLPAAEAATAMDTIIVPDAALWGVTRNNFRNMFLEYRFSNIMLKKQYALYIDGLTASGYTMEGYFVFAEPVGVYMGLSRIVYVLDVSTKVPDAKLNTCYKTLVANVTTTAKPDSSTGDETVWTSNGSVMRIGIGQMTEYNDSDSRAVYIIFEPDPAQKKPTAKPTKTPKPAATKKATKTPKPAATKKATKTPKPAATKKATNTPRPTATRKATRTPKPTATVKPKTQQMTYRAEARMVSNNRVGDTWWKRYYINGEKVNPEGTLKLKAGDVLMLKGQLIEDDVSPDYGQTTVEHTVTANDLKNGFTEEFQVRVIEDSGIYKGHVAIWTVTFTFTP